MPDERLCIEVECTFPASPELIAQIRGDRWIANGGVACVDPQTAREVGHDPGDERMLATCRRCGVPIVNVAAFTFV